MIEIEKNSDNGFPAPRPKKKLFVQVAAGVLMLALLGAGFWTLWLFLSPSRTVTLKEGAEYTYRGYTVSLEKTTVQFCPNGPDEDCPRWIHEDGAQIRYTNPKINGIVFDYLGFSSKRVLELDGLKIELLSSNNTNKTVKLKLTKT